LNSPDRQITKSYFLVLPLFGEPQQRNRACPLDRDGQLSLMPHTIAGDSSWDNSTALRQKISEQPDILEVDRELLVTEAADSPPLE
jgi:hypothetical protein